MTDLDEATIERAVGAVVGSAVGDALGAGYEFSNPGPDLKIAMIGGGPFNWDPGEWTDDTQMALAVLDVLATGDADVQAIAANFFAWYASGPPDIGRQTRSARASSTSNVGSSSKMARLNSRPPSVPAIGVSSGTPDAARCSGVNEPFEMVNTPTRQSGGKSRCTIGTCMSDDAATGTPSAAAS